MPSNYCSEYDKSKHWKEARRQVRAKFPTLLEGSSGWNRAVQNRFNRIYSQRL